MPPPKTSKGPPAVALAAVAAAGTLVGIGLFPKCSDLQTTSAAMIQHEVIVETASVAHMQIAKDMDRERDDNEEIKQLIRDSISNQNRAMTEQSTRIEKIDQRVWSILREIKK